MIQSAPSLSLKLIKSVLRQESLITFGHDRKVKPVSYKQRIKWVGYFFNINIEMFYECSHFYIVVTQLDLLVISRLYIYKWDCKMHLCFIDQRLLLVYNSSTRRAICGSLFLSFEECLFHISAQVFKINLINIWDFKCVQQAINNWMEAEMVTWKCGSLCDHESHGEFQQDHKVGAQFHILKKCGPFWTKANVSRFSLNRGNKETAES